MGMRASNTARTLRAAALIARVRDRREQRGAAVFLVVMVMTIIAAIGVFSMRSASLVDLATGYNRQAIQTTFMAEYAARAAATYLEKNPALVSGTERVTGCAEALQELDLSAPCTVFKTSLLAEALDLDDLVDGANGQLNTTGDPTSIDAEFVTEMTEPSMANITASPGFTAGLFKQVTFTSIARVYPTDGSATDVCSTAARGSVSQRTVRAHVIVPM